MYEFQNLKEKKGRSVAVVIWILCLLYILRYCGFAVVLLSSCIFTYDVSTELSSLIHNATLFVIDGSPKLIPNAAFWRIAICFDKAWLVKSFITSQTGKGIDNIQHSSGIWPAGCVWMPTGTDKIFQFFRKLV